MMDFNNSNSHETLQIRSDFAFLESHSISSEVNRVEIFSLFCSTAFNSLLLFNKLVCFNSFSIS